MSKYEVAAFEAIGLISKRIKCDECEADCTANHVEYENRKLCLDCDAHVGRYRPWTVEEILAREG